MHRHTRKSAKSDEVTVAAEYNAEVASCHIPTNYTNRVASLS